MIVLLKYCIATTVLSAESWSSTPADAMASDTDTMPPQRMSHQLQLYLTE